MSNFKMPPLSPEEERVIRHKGTEAPGSGRYWRHDAEGGYRCRQCGALLFNSDDKFNSECGWPSFDEAAPGAVRELPDADGRRMEIVCAECGGHLGHVFRGEKLTPKDARYCVNSLSLAFTPAKAETAVFAGGCFWGVEAAFRQASGVLETVVGYTGGFTENPTYEEVCDGNTGHAEAVRIVFDPAAVRYEDLARLFFEIHDPTQLNRQGPDFGPQYRSAVFYADERQKLAAEELVRRLRDAGWPVVTELSPLGEFYPAEEYHQRYFEKQNLRDSCHRREPRFEKGPRG